MVLDVFVGLVVFAGSLRSLADLVGFKHLDGVGLLFFKNLRLTFDIPLLGGIVLRRLDLLFYDGLSLFLFLLSVRFGTTVLAHVGILGASTT